MALPRRVAGVVAVTAALLGLSPALACAEPVAVTSSEVVKTLALATQPTDFVVLVDSSSSMAKGKRPAAVRSQLTALLDIMEPTDRLALFTYDSSVTLRYRGLVADQGARVLHSLPTPTRGWSDQGAALEAGVAELARDGANPQAVVVLITDGRPDPAPGSDYQSESGAAWRELIANGNRIAAQRPVAGYQFSVTREADATMLTRVFPGTRAVGSAAVGRQITAITAELTQDRVARVIGAELESPITLSWSGDFSSGSDGWLPVRVAVRSPFTYLPVVLSDLRVQASGGVAAAVRGLPDAIELAPGQTKELDAQVRLDRDGDLRELGLTFDASIDSPWRTALTETFDLAFTPQLVTVAGAGSPAGLEGVLPTAITAGGLLGLSVLVWLLGNALVTPRMRGELIFSMHAEEVARVVLRGRRSYLAGLSGNSVLASVAGNVYGARPIRGSEREVRVDLAAGRSWARGVIHDGGVIQMGDIEIAYSSEPGAIVRPSLVH